MNSKLLLLLLPVAAIAGVVFAQRPLTPTGAPAPVMKTLDQVEPRTPISSLPFTISQSGSYYFTRSFLFTVGITGTHPNRTWTMIPGGFATGIGALDNDSSITECRFEDLTIRGCPTGGLLTGPCAVVARVTATHNGGYGIFTGDNSTVSNCVATRNMGNGINVASGSVSACAVEHSGQGSTASCVSGAASPGVPPAGVKPSAYNQAFASSRVTSPNWNGGGRCTRLNVEDPASIAKTR